MPPLAFQLLMGLTLTMIASFGITALVRPSQYIRWSKNPWMDDTPWTRLQMRGVGLIFCLVVIMGVSGFLKERTNSGVLQGFHENIVIALWVAFVATWVFGIISFTLWRFAPFRI